MNNKILIPILAAALLFGCAQPSPTSPTALPSLQLVQLLEYSNENFSMLYPEDWTVQANAIGGVSFSAKNANIQVFETTDLGGAKTLDEYVELNKKSITPEFLRQTTGVEVKSVDVLSDSVKTVNGLQGRALIIRIDMNGVVMKQQQLYLLGTGKAYILTGTSLESEFENANSNFNELFNSFKAK